MIYSTLYNITQHITYKLIIQLLPSLIRIIHKKQIITDGIRLDAKQRAMFPKTNAFLEAVQCLQWFKNSILVVFRESVALSATGPHQTLVNATHKPTPPSQHAYTPIIIETSVVCKMNIDC